MAEAGYRPATYHHRIMTKQQRQPCMVVVTGTELVVLDVASEEEAVSAATHPKGAMLLLNVPLYNVSRLGTHPLILLCVSVP